MEKYLCWHLTDPCPKSRLALIRYIEWSRFDTKVSTHTQRLTQNAHTHTHTFKQTPMRTSLSAGAHARTHTKKHGKQAKLDRATCLQPVYSTVLTFSKLPLPGKPAAAQLRNERCGDTCTQLPSTFANPVDVGGLSWSARGFMARATTSKRAGAHGRSCRSALQRKRSVSFHVRRVPPHHLVPWINQAGCGTEGQLSHT